MLGLPGAKCGRFALVPSKLLRHVRCRYPLSLKVSCWLLLNLLLLAAAGIAFYIVHFGLGWESLIDGAPGERLQAIGDGIAGQLPNERASARDVLLRRAAERYGADFFLFHNQGTQLGGPAVSLPAPVFDAMSRSPRRGLPQGEEPPPPEFGPPDGSEPARRVPRHGGRFIFSLSEPSGYWIGIRVPVAREDGGLPLRGTLIIRAPSLAALGRLLGLGPWVAAGASALGLSVLFWLPLVRSVTHALRRLTDATAQIAEGNFATRVPENRRDELGHLGAAVNRMAAQLATQSESQKRFLGDVAHELGSPLGRLNVAVELLERRTPTELHLQIADVRDEVEHMSALVNELLAFTKADLRPRAADLAAVDLVPLVAQTVAREGAGGQVVINLGPGMAVRADAPLLARALGNLVRNALRYAGPKALIAVTARRDGEHVLVAVEDSGPGVPAEALGRLGEPFYRPEAARTRETGGVGLGLAIVRSSVAACGGEVRFANRTPHGFRAELRLLAA